MDAIILAGGQGKRMKSLLPKVLHTVLGEPILYHVVSVVRKVSRKGIYLIIGVGADDVKKWISGRFEDSNFHFVLQKRQKGTGHAVMQVAPHKRKLSQDILVMCGDTPLIGAPTLKALMRVHKKRKAHCTLLTARLENPFGYGRVLRDSRGHIQKIVEQPDATPEEKCVKEINSSTYCFNRDALFSCLKEIKPQNRQNEFYLTDVVECMLKKNYSVEAYCVDDSREVLGINSRADLAVVSSHMKDRVLTQHMLSGVTFVEPTLTTLDVGVKIGKDTVVHPYCVLRGDTRIGKNCEIGPSCTIKDSRIGNGASVLHSVLTGSSVGDSARVGPFAHLRPGARIGKNVRVGNFVEIKNSVVEDYSTCAHLTYIGDSHIGKHVNVGAGTITCNYDGAQKHRTVIEAGAFIGSDTVLVAPVKIGKGAYTGAGSVITKDVPPYALSVARAQQKNVHGWAKKRKQSVNKNKKHEEKK